jgi:predicted TPR repeat methyltransferase
MVYLGDLTPTFRGVVNRLVGGGYYLFACEAKAGEGWEQTDVSRFRHSESYLREEALRANLVYFARMDCTLRYEREAPVPGFAVVLQKPA